MPAARQFLVVKNLIFVRRRVLPGAIDASQSSPVGDRVETHVVACAHALVQVTVRDKWGNPNTNQTEHVSAVIVGGGANNGSTEARYETLMVCST